MEQGPTRQLARDVVVDVDETVSGAKRILIFCKAGNPIRRVAGNRPN